MSGGLNGIVKRSSTGHRMRGLSAVSKVRRNLLISLLFWAELTILGSFNAAFARSIESSQMGEGSEYSGTAGFGRGSGVGTTSGGGGCIRISYLQFIYIYESL